MKINLRGLNTALMIREESRHNNNYITCKCSQSTVIELKPKIEAAGAKDVIYGKCS